MLTRDQFAVANLVRIFSTDLRKITITKYLRRAVLSAT